MLSRSCEWGGLWRVFWGRDLDKGKLTFLPNQKQKAGILRVQGADRGHMDSRYNPSSRRRTIQHLQMQITPFSLLSTIEFDFEESKDKN